MLSSDEIETIEEGISFLQAAVRGADYRQIRAGIERLDKATRRFAELMMDNAVSGAMQGKTMEAAGENIGEGPTAPHPFAKAEINRK
jgi:molecular chaperone DnaK/molecular chaperone HscA